MFKKNKKDDKEKAKLKKKLRKHAIREQMKYDKKRKEAEKIKDEAYVQEKLAIERLKDEELMKKRDEVVKKNLAGLMKDIKDFKCKACGNKVQLENLTCPMCGQLYCQYCGAKMDMMNPGKCPKCGGVPMYQPAELVITKVEDIAPEDRFWEELPSCPKCGAAVQPDWAECPICGQKLSGDKALDEGDADEGIWTEDDLMEEEIKKKLESPKDIARRKRQQKAKKGRRGV
ncbi:MAG: hypothetical protein GF364_13725 [Candidatus Lokiarchaeota archaeon]|nr:hypothetical protein [Candidatus Lokiarchaeota archaeon]